MQVNKYALSFEDSLLHLKTELHRILLVYFRWLQMPMNMPCCFTTSSFMRVRVGKHRMQGTRPHASVRVPLAGLDLSALLLPWSAALYGAHAALPLPGPLSATPMLRLGPA